MDKPKGDQINFTNNQHENTIFLIGKRGIKLK